MTLVTLFVRGGREAGFELSGHATVDAEDEDGRLICAALSSAAIMAANTLTEILGAPADICQKDGYLRVRLANQAAQAERILQGFTLHVRGMADEYPGKIRIETEEIQDA